MENSWKMDEGNVWFVVDTAESSELWPIIPIYPYSHPFCPYNPYSPAIDGHWIKLSTVVPEVQS